jgi:hypothetical protein
VGDSLLFVFGPEVSMTDVEQTLHLAMIAVEGLAGSAQVRMEACYLIDADRHVITVDGGNRVGRLISRVFAGLLYREFGEDAFRIERGRGGSHEPKEVSA